MRFLHCSSPRLVAAIWLTFALNAFSGAIMNSTFIHKTKPEDTPIKVVPDRGDWTYEIGQPAVFRITVDRQPYPAEGVTVSYRLGPEKFEAPERTVVIPAEGLSLAGGTLSTPGFLRCLVTATVDGVKKRGLATAAFAPEQLQGTANDPADFDAFWADQKAALAKIPIEPVITPAPEISTPEVEVSYVSFKNVAGRFYGLLSMPRGPGPFPAALMLPGSGVWRRGGDSGSPNDIPPDLALAKRGVIVLQCGVHGIPLNLPPELYSSLESGALADYFSFNNQDRERSYFRRVIMGCLRANDYLVTLPKWDGKNLIVKGGSQGGMLAIMTGALDSRVTAIAPFFPASGGITPPPGSPQAIAAAAKAAGFAAAAAIDPAAPQVPAGDYYATINFARRLKIPGFYTWGYNDEACVPTTTVGLYNIVTAPKQLLVVLEQGHGTDPEQKIRGDEWIAGQGKQPPKNPE